MIHERTDCRLCSEPLESVFALIPTPIANSFALEPDEGAERYPIELMQCVSCDHVQLRHVVSGIFHGGYKYETPKTDHLSQSAKALREAYPQAVRVLEIGSNNGAYLECLGEAGFQALGIDPAASGGCAIPVAFNSYEARNFRAKFDLIIANNVFAHIDDLADVFLGIDKILAEDGAVVFEVQYLVSLLEMGAFDMIYHEHMSYHTLKPLANFCRRMGMVMTRWEPLTTHGGSIRVTVKRKGREALIPQEKLNWFMLRERIEAVKSRLLRAAVVNQPLVAFGASAKACTLIHQCGLAPFLAYCVDDTPGKQGRYLPGTEIVIKPVSALNGEAVLATAWNYYDLIRERLPNNKIVHPFTI